MCLDPILLFMPCVFVCMCLDPFLRGYFELFPYSLPSLINFALFTISLAATVLLLPETLGMKE